MDAPIHDHPPAARQLPSVRTIAALTLGVGIGVVAALPLGGGTAIPAVVAVVAASAAAALAILRPNHPAAVVGADVALGLAVIATVFGRLGVLYVPLLLAFLVVTARIERTPERSEAGLEWEPAPEFEDPFAPSIAAPPPIEELTPAPIEEPMPFPVERPLSATVEARSDTEEPTPLPAPVLIRLTMTSGPVIDRAGRPEVISADETDAASLEEPVAGPTPAAGRHRAPSPARRMASATARLGRRLGEQARAGAGNIREALVTGTDGEPPDPADVPAFEEPIPAKPGAIEPPPPNTALDELRHDFEERELELVAAGRSWSSLTHRAYGELRTLQPPKAPAPPRRRPVVHIDDVDWERPTWKSMGED